MEGRGAGATRRSTLTRVSGTLGTARSSGSSRLPSDPEIPLQSKRFAIRTYGCQMNVHDSEKVATLLENSGLVAAPNESEADVLVQLDLPEPEGRWRLHVRQSDVPYAPGTGDRTVDDLMSPVVERLDEGRDIPPAERLRRLIPF